VNKAVDNLAADNLAVDRNLKLEIFSTSVYKIQRVTEISTLILTSGRSRQEHQNCYVPTIFSKYNFHFSVLRPHKLTSCLFSM
jgi:hypothetical protein